MFNILNILRGFRKYDSRTAIVDNWVFQLSYGVAAPLLVTFCAIVTTDQFFGSPINCYISSRKDTFPDRFLDNYCWIHSTFTIPKYVDKKQGDEVAYDGVDKHVTGESRTYHQYYQWVCLFLLFQAMTFYGPRFVWKRVEGGEIQQLLLGLHNPFVSNEYESTTSKDQLPKTTKKDLKRQAPNSRILMLANYMMDTLGEHDGYALCYFACEFLNVVNAIAQIYLTNWFLGGQFYSYAWTLLQSEQFSGDGGSEQHQSTIQVFPRMTKCTFYKYGPSGDVDKHDILCVLPINVINEKVFAFLWFWYWTMAIIGIGLLLYRVPMLCFKKLRWRVLTYRRRRFVDKKQLETVLIAFGLGDWLLLNFISKNMAPTHFNGLVASLANVLRRSHGVEEC